MSKQKEGSLQERIQHAIRKRGWYVNKNHGDMISEPGIPDLVSCIYGKFVGIEVKVDNNTPSKAQGIHCRKIWNAGGIAIVVWSVEEVEKFLDIMLNRNKHVLPMIGIREELSEAGIDDGTRW